MSLAVTQLVGFGASQQTENTYRYLRFTITSTAGATAIAILWELDYSADGGSTWLPSTTMTSNSGPSPLVASADSEFSSSYLAYKAFDNSDAGDTNRWTSANTAMPHWIQIDLGAGNGILPNRVRWKVYNSGSDYSPTAGNIKGSNTGSFAGEEVTIHSFSGLSGNANKTEVTRTI